MKQMKKHHPTPQTIRLLRFYHLLYLGKFEKKYKQPKKLQMFFQGFATIYDL
jgi:hypothetical protein